MASPNLMNIWEKIQPYLNSQTTTTEEKFLKEGPEIQGVALCPIPTLHAVTILQCHFLIFKILLLLLVIPLLSKIIKSSKLMYCKKILHDWLHAPRMGLWAATVTQASGCCWDEFQQEPAMSCSQAPPPV